MSSIFTKIINKEEKAYIVWQDSDVIVFLPKGHFINKGHLLVVPKVEVDYIFDLDDNIYHKLWSIAKKLSKPLKELTNAKRVGVAVEGFSVAHVHIHLTPLYNQGELDPNRSVSWSEEERKLFVNRLKKELSKG